MPNEARTEIWKLTVYSYSQKEDHWQYDYSKGMKWFDFGSPWRRKTSSSKKLLKILKYKCLTTCSLCMQFVIVFIGLSTRMRFKMCNQQICIRPTW